MGKPEVTQRRKLRFLVVTAFDSKYEVGYLCSTVNEAYCRRHGYSFRRVLPTPEGMSLLSGHRHCAWGKVALVHHLLGGDIPPQAAEIAGPRMDDVDYVVWVDADAMVLNHERKLEDFVDAAGGADFIVGEDMADTDLLNTGLFFCRTGSSWMRELMRRWWVDSDAKWHFEVCWDQTGLCRLLEKEDGLGVQKPWFSWQGGTRRKKFGSHSFVFDCGSFNFKYLNNCDFVFHAVGERELIFSFSRSLSLKRERLYTAVEQGLVDGGAGFALDEELPEMRSEGVRARLAEAHAVWQAHGVGKQGLRGRPPPIGWGPAPQHPHRASRIPVVRSGESQQAAVTEHFVMSGGPVVLEAAWSASEEPGWRCLRSLEALAAACGDAVVRLSRCAPMRGPDVLEGAVLHRARVWQLCEYALGRSPPLGPLRFSNPSCVWRAFEWPAWEEESAGEAGAVLRSLALWAPAAVRGAVVGLAGAGPAALDVEPPSAVTRLHRRQEHALLAVLSGEKELQLFSPEDGEQLQPGAGTCDPDQSPHDPSDPRALRPPTCSAVLRPGDVLLVPSGWWCWARACTAAITLRRGFSDARIAEKVARQQQLRSQELRAVLQPPPELLRALRSGGPGDVACLEAGEGPAVGLGQFAAVHFAVYDGDGRALESSRFRPTPWVLEAKPPMAANSPQLASLPVGIREAAALGLLVRNAARVGARYGISLGAAAAGQAGGPAFAVLDVVELLERRSDGGGLAAIAGPRRTAAAAARPPAAAADAAAVSRRAAGVCRAGAGFAARACGGRARGRWAERCRRTVAVD